MTTIKEMRAELAKAHREGHVEDIRLMSDISGAPKDAFQVMICYLALEAARGSYGALTACNALKDFVNEKERM